MISDSELTFVSVIRWKISWYCSVENKKFTKKEHKISTNFFIRFCLLKITLKLFNWPFFFLIEWWIRILHKYVLEKRNETKWDNETKAHVQQNRMKIHQKFTFTETQNSNKIKQKWNRLLHIELKTKIKNKKHIK